MAKTPEFKKPEGVTVKQPVGNLFGDEPPIVAEVANVVYKTPEIEWLDIPTPPGPRYTACAYPYSGEPVWLTPDGVTEYIGVWRVTRELRDGRFQPTAFWSIYNGGGQRIGFDPIGYRKYKPPIFVPRKRA